MYKNRAFYEFSSEKKIRFSKSYIKSDFFVREYSCYLYIVTGIDYNDGIPICKSRIFFSEIFLEFMLLEIAIGYIYSN